MMEVKKLTSRFTKYLTTTIISYCTFAYGCGFTFLSPAVVDFSKKYDTDVKEISIVFTVLTGSFAFGALTYGVVSNFLNRRIIVICLLSLMSGALVSIPHAGTIPVFYFLSGCLGFGSGGYEAAQISWTIDIWQAESAPFILIQYFAFAVGTVVPSLLVGPFLQNKDDTKNSTTLSKILQTTSESDLRLQSDLFIPFTVAASLLVGGVLIQMLHLWKLRSKNSDLKIMNNVKNEKIVNETETNDTQLSSKWRVACLIFLSCCVIGIYQGMELTTTQFLPTFAVYSEVSLSEFQSAKILFGLTLSYAISRGIGILLVLKIPSQFILCGNLFLLIVSNLILLFLSQTSVTWLWIGSVSTGVAMSTACPSAYAFIENHLHVTDRVASVIVVTAGTVSAISPLLVGNSVEFNPSILCYVNLASISVLCLSFSTMFWFVMLKK